MLESSVEVKAESEGDLGPRSQSSSFEAFGCATTCSSESDKWQKQTGLCPKGPGEMKECMFRSESSAYVWCVFDASWVCRPTQMLSMLDEPFYSLLQLKTSQSASLSQLLRCDGDWSLLTNTHIDMLICWIELKVSLYLVLLLFQLIHTCLSGAIVFISMRERILLLCLIQVTFHWILTKQNWNFSPLRIQNFQIGNTWCVTSNKSWH